MTSIRSCVSRLTLGGLEFPDVGVASTDVSDNACSIASTRTCLRSSLSVFRKDNSCGGLSGGVIRRYGDGDTVIAFWTLKLRHSSQHIVPRNDNRISLADGHAAKDSSQCEVTQD